MTDQTHQEPPANGEKDLFVNLVLAFCVTIAIGMIWKPLTGMNGTVAMYDVAIFFGIVISNPYQAWRNRIGLRSFGIRFGIAVVIGALLGLAGGSDFLFDGERAGWGRASALVLCGTVFLALLSFERLRRGDIAKTNPRQAKKSVRMPVFLAWSVLLQLSVAGVLWSLGAAPWQALVVMLTAVTLCSLEVVMCDPSDRPCWSAVAWNPAGARRTTTFNRAIEQSFASGLFVGGLFYLICTTTLPAVALFGPDMAGGQNIAFALILAAGVALMLFLVPTALSVAALTIVMFAWSRRNNGKWPGFWVAGSLAGNRLINGGVACIARADRKKMRANAQRSRAAQA